eukprot:44621-Pleurochrysis_carterae.AAC.2
MSVNYGIDIHINGRWRCCVAPHGSGLQGYLCPPICISQEVYMVGKGPSEFEAKVCRTSTNAYISSCENRECCREHRNPLLTPSLSLPSVRAIKAKQN